MLKCYEQTSSFQIWYLLQVSKYLGQGMFTMVQHLLFFSEQLEDIWASWLWVSVMLVLKFGLILAWYRFPATEEFVAIFDIFVV